MSTFPGDDVVSATWSRTSGSATDSYGDRVGLAPGFPLTVRGSLGASASEITESGLARTTAQFLSSEYTAGRVGDIVTIESQEYRVVGVSTPRDLDGRITHATYTLALLASD
jgi:hypothetical protein